MADALTQIQQSQARARDQQLAGAQRDLSWDATFGRMAPDHVLRETRNMTALIANAVEKKMELAAQTSAEAQRIYLNDQKWKAEQRMQPLKDEHLKAQIAADEARARATAATELLATSRLEKEARAVEHTASAQWELDQLEGSSLPDSEKRAWLNTVRGKYPEMDAAAAARHKGLHERLNPDVAKPLTPAQQELSTHRELRRLQSRDAQLARDVSAVEKEKPAWMESTGYEPKTGQFRFANEDEDKGGTKPFKPSEAQLAQYQSYRASVAERAKIADAVGQHEAKLNAGFVEPAATTPPAAAVPVVDKVALAKQALSDPNASEAHKAAARKILSGQ